jgi:hypothetical protein
MIQPNIRLTIGSAMLCALSGAAVATAHHSTATTRTRSSTSRGTVKEVHLINPHSWVYLDVKAANGQSQTWSLESDQPRGSGTHGVSRPTSSSLETGQGALPSRCATALAVVFLDS